MNRRAFAPFFLAFATAVFGQASTQAGFELAPVISDHMVIQRSKPIVLWGWDAPGQQINVTLDGSNARATADAQGRWLVTLPAMPAGGPYEIVISGSVTVTVKDVLIGEVWLCSGQSNMEWTVALSDNPQEEIAAANFPLIRHIKVPHIPADKPQQNVAAGGWKVCSPSTVANYTAVGYFFARKLHKDLDGVPIGLIGSNWGGTRIEPWIPPVGFQSVPALKDIADNLAKYPTRNQKGEIEFQTSLALYNGMIAPFVPYGIRGALWYQGESNNGEGMLYFEKKKALIEGWRKVWNDPNMPFLFVQLAPFVYGNSNPENLAGIWEAQAKTLEIPNTGMAVTVDIANLTDIHPKNKQDVGKRLALWALAKTYGKTVPAYSGPLYKGHAVENGAIRVSFDHVGTGLVSRDEKPLSWWEVAGEDGAFKKAEATIDGETVVVKSAEVTAPVAVRFGWNQSAEPNLSNKEGLPASPFRAGGK
jgi:sialate O-acetylesterase